MKTFLLGQSIIEVLLAMALALILLPALFGMLYVSTEGKAQHKQRVQAMALARELEDSVRSVREIGWDNFASYVIGSAYHPVQSGNHWALSLGNETVGSFTRSITIQRVYRNASGVIVTSGGTEDLSTRRIDISVSWVTPLPASVSYSMYLTRHDNILITDTTAADFSSGTLTNTAVRNNIDGEVVLGATGGFGDWCNPTLTITALDLPKSGVANAVSAIQGQLAAGTGDNAAGVSYANVTISDPSFPTNPTASISGTFDGYKTNDVFTEQNYAYLATDTNSKEVEIIDLSHTDSSNKYSEAGYFNAPGNGNASAVATSGSVGYMVGGTKLYNFDLSSKTGSRSALDSDGVTLPSSGNRMVIIGSRAFIVTESTSAQLVIADISNNANLTIKRQIGLSASGGAGLFVNSSGTRAYVVTHTSSSQREFFIIDIEESSATYGNVLSSYDTNGMNPKGVVVVSGPRAIVVGTGGEEYQVLDITNESASPLPRCGGLQIDNGVNGVSTVFAQSQRAYSYLVTGDASTELKIIEGGPGSSGNSYVLNGTFTSRIFDMQSIATGSAQAVFNRFAASISKPSSVTDISLQVAGADAVSNSCTDASYTYVGPDGTNATSFTSVGSATISGAIPFSNDNTGYENPARCFRYKAALSTTDSTLTSQLLDMTISFSP